MDIKDIKAKLSILEVLQHYGLRPDKNDRLKCPFHPDKTPSFQVYPKTNTYCCFSSNCNAGTGDAIQFIELYEKCSKHEALVKAAELAGGEATAHYPNHLGRYVYRNRQPHQNRRINQGLRPVQKGFAIN